MAEVIPFKGYRYNSELIDNMADVVAPPYDVISPQGQLDLYQRHPQNIIRLILGQCKAGDTEENNVYTRAAETLIQWRRDQILKQDDEPNFYITRVDFKVDNRSFYRFGLFGGVGIRPFSDGVILPHEHTFSKVKSERLQLMQKTNANLCPIFGLYADEMGEMYELQSSLTQFRPADIDLIDDDGFRHRLWCIEDNAFHVRITDFFDAKKIYIADGHHRYETALNYRDWLKSKNSAFSPSHPANYIMMSMSSMQDPGMVILPAHRAVRALPQIQLEDFLNNISDFFEVMEMPEGVGLRGNLDAAMRILEENATRNAIGVMMKNPKAFKILLLKPGMMDQLFEKEIETPLRDLDVTVLTHLVFIRLLGLSQAALDDQGKIQYCTDPGLAADMVESEDVSAAFLLNPTKIEQVQRIAEAGLTMPRKTTYFFPKAISGQVFNILE